MLNDEIGSRTELGGRTWIATRQGVAGHAVYGPYIDLDAGDYAVEFEIALLAVQEYERDEVCAAGDVVSDWGKRRFAHRDVRLSDLRGGPHTIVLPFHTDMRRMFEFRVATNGLRRLAAREERPVSSLDAAQFDRTMLMTIDDRLGRLELRLADLISDQESGFVGPKGAIGRRALRSGHLSLQIADAVAFRRDSDNALYRAFVGSEEPLSRAPRRIGLGSSLCQQSHFGFDEYKFWARQLKYRPTYGRKQWEFFFISQVLFEYGMLSSGKRGLVFGAGQEPLPALFASFGAEVVASDQDEHAAMESGWVQTGQHTRDLSMLNQRGICTEQMFRELVSFLPVDMNAIPASLDGRFDFCWSSCSLEHLGSLQHGLDFIDNAMKTLKPGGVAVHTTEFNLSSNEDTIETGPVCLYRRRDIERLIDKMTDRGFVMPPIDWTLGEGFAEQVVDLPPYGRGEPHIRLRFSDYDVTSIGLIVEKAK